MNFPMHGLIAKGTPSESVLTLGIKLSVIFDFDDYHSLAFTLLAKRRRDNKAMDPNRICRGL